MPFNNRSKKPAGAAGAAGKGGKRKSRFAGVKAAAPRTPMPHVGTYRFEIVSHETGFNEGTRTESAKATFTIVALDDVGAENHKEGDEVVTVQLLSGPASIAGLARVKSFTMAAAGFDDEESFDEFDPDGEFIDAQLGEDNGREDGTIVGRYVDCEVIRGKDVRDKDGNPTGDYYREYRWAPVPEDEQPEGADHFIE